MANLHSTLLNLLDHLKSLEDESAGVYGIISDADRTTILDVMRSIVRARCLVEYTLQLPEKDEDRVIKIDLSDCTCDSLSVSRPHREGCPVKLRIEGVKR